MILRYFLDLGEAEIAETLGVHIGTVKSQLAKARATWPPREGSAREAGMPDDFDAYLRRCLPRRGRPVGSSSGDLEKSAVRA